MPNRRTTPSPPPDPRAPFLLDLLRRAGHAALRFEHDTRERLKPDGTKVTDADLAAHDVILEGLRAAFPADRVISEEGPPEGPEDAEATWYVDPLDGTGAFTEGLAHWGPTLARAVGDELEVGAFLEPAVGREWFAAVGAGAWCDGRRLRPAEPLDGKAHRTLYLPSQAHRLPALAWRGKVRALGVSAFHMAQVASGAAAATVVPIWSIWDVAAGILLVQEAGRVIRDLSGQPLDPMKSPGTPLVAAAPSVLDPLVDAIQDALKRYQET